MEEDKVSDSTSSTGEDIDTTTTETSNNEIKRLQNEKHTKHWYQDPNSIRIFIVAFLIMTFAIVEFVFGIYTNSLALLVDAFHMVSDLLSLIIGFFSLMLAKREKSRRYSYGWIRAEPIGALINGVFLLSLSFYIIIEALQRFITPPEIQDPIIILIVGGAGLGVNLIGLVIFGTSGGGGHGHSHGHSHKHKKEENGVTIEELSIKKAKRNVNIHGMFLHVLGDALGSIGAMISGVCIWQLPYSWRFYLDPVCSIVISCIILASTIPLVRTCVYILMQSVPHDVNLEEVEKALSKVEGVVNIHELHVWQLSNDKIIGTVHMACYKKEDFVTVATKMKKVLHSFGVHATTIQPEFVDKEQDSCVLSCQPDCTAELCCDTTNNGLSKRPNNKA